jgi:hypothetical protein
MNNENEIGTTKIDANPIIISLALNCFSMHQQMMKLVQNPRGIMSELFSLPIIHYAL